jgi:hypothetical protein
MNELTRLAQETGFFWALPVVIAWAAMYAYAALEDRGYIDKK